MLVHIQGVYFFAGLLYEIVAHNNYFTGFISGIRYTSSVYIKSCTKRFILGEKKISDMGGIIT